MMKADGTKDVVHSWMTDNPNEANPTGIWPTEFNVLIDPVKVDEKTKGGIILPDEKKDRDQFAQMEGRILVTSPHAFSYADDWPVGSKPCAGSRVIFAQYSGSRPIKGKDGKEYRLVKDKDILAVLT